MSTHSFHQLVPDLDLATLPPQDQAAVKAQFLRWGLTQVLIKLEHDAAYDYLDEFAHLVQTGAPDSQLEDAFAELSSDNRQKISEAMHSVQTQFQRVHYSQILKSLELDLELAESEAEKQQIQDTTNSLTKKITELTHSSLSP